MDLALILGIPSAVAGLIAIVASGGRLIRWALGGIEKRDAKKEAIFQRNRYRIDAPGFPRTRFHIDYKIAGASASSHAGAVSKGEGLLVCLQDWELSRGGLAVWLTVENISERVYRWFGPEVTAYGRIPYDQISPASSPEHGPWIMNIYPGEQYTCYYSFPFPEHVTGTKYLTCKSWDEPLTFWWAHGA